MSATRQAPGARTATARPAPRAVAAEPREAVIVAAQTREADIVAAEPRDMDAVRALFREYAASVDAPACFDGFEQEMAALPGDCAAPLGGILLARDPRRAAAVGVVAYRALAPGLAELKRLFVQPDWRGRGLGRRLVEAALTAAAARGHAAVRLSTMPQQMQAADRLYRDLGFQPIPRYPGAGDGAACYELAL